MQRAWCRHIQYVFLIQSELHLSYFLFIFRFTSPVRNLHFNYLIEVFVHSEHITVIVVNRLPKADYVNVLGSISAFLVFRVKQVDYRVILARLVPNAHLFLKRSLEDKLAIRPDLKHEVASEKPY